MRKFRIFASVVAAICCFSFFASLGTPASAEQADAYTLVNAQDGYCLYLGDELCVKSDIDGINAYIGDIEGAYSLTLGDGAALVLSDDTLILSGRCTLAGKAEGAPLLDSSVLRFDGESFVCTADIKSGSSSAATTAVYVSRADSVRFSSCRIDGGCGAGVYIASDDTSVKVEGTVTSGNTTALSGTFVAQGQGCDIELKGSVTNSSVSESAHVVNIMPQFDGVVKYTGGALGFYSDTLSSARGTIVANASSGLFEMTAGDLRLASSAAVAIVNSGSGTVKISGGTIDSGKGLAIANVGCGEIVVDELGGEKTLITSSHVNEGTINSSGIGDTRITVNAGQIVNSAVADITADPHIRFMSYAIYTNNSQKCDIAINGGMLSIGRSELYCAAVYYGSNGVLALNDGVILCESGYAIVNGRAGSVKVDGGIVFAGKTAYYNAADGEIIISQGTTEAVDSIAQNELSCGSITYTGSPELNGTMSAFGNVSAEDFAPVSAVTVDVSGRGSGELLIKGDVQADKLVCSSDDGGLVGAESGIYFVYKIDVLSSDGQTLIATLLATYDGKYPDPTGIKVENGYRAVGYSYDGKTVKPGDALAADGRHAVTLITEKIPASGGDGNNTALIVSLSVVGGVVFAAAVAAVVVFAVRRKKHAAD